MVFQIFGSGKLRSCGFCFQFPASGVWIVLRKFSRPGRNAGKQTPIRTPDDASEGSQEKENPGLPKIPFST